MAAPLATTERIVVAPGVSITYSWAVDKLRMRTRHPLVLGLRSIPALIDVHMPYREEQAYYFYSPVFIHLVFELHPAAFRKYSFRI